MHKYTITGVFALFLIFSDYLCGSVVEGVEIPVTQKLCKCLKAANVNGFRKCKCIGSELKAIPNDLPTPLHAL